MRKSYKTFMTAVFMGMVLAAGADITAHAAGTESAVEESINLSRWELRSDGWYYYGVDGRLASGWIMVGDQYFYLTETGRCLQNAITPDGYYVNPDGVWQVRSTAILGNQFQAPEKVCTVTNAWTGAETMKGLQGQLKEVFSKRKIRITESSMEYVVGEDEVLLGIYKNTLTGGYRMDIRTVLDKSSTALDETATYDYAVFRAFLYQLTTTPDYLEDAIYSSWQEENRWNIQRNSNVWVGDSEVRYSAGAGCGYYYIYPAGQK